MTDVEKLIELVHRDEIPELDEFTRLPVMSLLVQFGQEDGVWSEDLESVLAFIHEYQNLLKDEARKLAYLDADIQEDIFEKVEWLRHSYKQVLIR